MKTLLEERKEILGSILQYLSQYMELDINLILTCKAEEYVKARALVIKSLADYYSDKEISQLTGLTVMGVNNIRNKFVKNLYGKSVTDMYQKLKPIFSQYFFNK